MFCYDGKTYDKCNGMTYNPTTHICQGKVSILAECNNIGYNPLIEFCSNNEIHPKCKGEEYDPNEIFCYNNEESSCGNQAFNPNIHFCVADVRYDKCGGEDYNIEDEFCWDNQIAPFCGERKNVEYDPTLYTCKSEKNSNGIYLINTVSINNNEYEAILIGDQTWLAADVLFVSNTWDSAIKTCPTGWHLPTKTEWETLINYVGGIKQARKLRANSSWNEIYAIGTDDYGFSALPLTGGNIGAWWSSTSETDNDNRAYYLYLNNESLTIETDLKTNTSKKFRCIMGD